MVLAGRISRGDWAGQKAYKDRLWLIEGIVAQPVYRLVIRE